MNMLLDLAKIRRLPTATAKKSMNGLSLPLPSTDSPIQRLHMAFFILVTNLRRLVCIVYRVCQKFFLGSVSKMVGRDVLPTDSVDRDLQGWAKELSLGCVN